MKKRNQEIYEKMLIAKSYNVTKLQQEYNLSRTQLYNIFNEMKRKDLTSCKPSAKM